MSNLLRRRQMMVGGSPTPPSGHPFSISASQQVIFSPSCLQYHCLNNEWRFAPTQYECVGDDNQNISPTYNGWIDLFGYGTSGWNSGANEYLPTSISTTASDYINQNLTGAYANADWGIYNAIYNTETGNIDPAGTWRTPLGSELLYLLNNRTTPSGVRFARCIVHGWNGGVLLPDDWDSSIYQLTNINSGGGAFSQNTISDADWDIMESYGCVFVGQFGVRAGTSTAWPNSPNIIGNITTAQNNGTSYNSTLEIAGGGFGMQNRVKYIGKTVRLVRNV